MMRLTQPAPFEIDIITTLQLGKLRLQFEDRACKGEKEEFCCFSILWYLDVHFIAVILATGLITLWCLGAWRQRDPEEVDGRNKIEGQLWKGQFCGTGIHTTSHSFSMNDFHLWFKSPLSLHFTMPSWPSGSWLNKAS